MKTQDVQTSATCLARAISWLIIDARSRGKRFPYARMTESRCARRLSAAHPNTSGITQFSAIGATVAVTICLTQSPGPNLENKVPNGDNDSNVSMFILTKTGTRSKIRQNAFQMRVFHLRIHNCNKQGKFLHSAQNNNSAKDAPTQHKVQRLSENRDVQTNTLMQSDVKCQTKQKFDKLFLGTHF